MTIAVKKRNRPSGDSIAVAKTGAQRNQFAVGGQVPDMVLADVELQAPAGSDVVAATHVAPKGNLVGPDRGLGHERRCFGTADRCPDAELR